MENQIINNSNQLWDMIEICADFKSTIYDKELIRDIKKNLDLPLSGSMHNLLNKYNILPEELLIAVLKSLKPYSQMMNDLLCMFEKAKAQMSDNNLIIKFDFKNNKTCFDFNFENFKQYVTRVNEVQKSITIFKIDNPWDLVVCLRQGINIYFDKTHKLEPDIKQWILEYTEMDIFPNFFPKCPKTKLEKLDRKISIIWEVFKTAILEYRKAYDPQKGRRYSHQEECEKRNDDYFWIAENDYWTCSLITNLCHHVTKINSLNGEEKDEAITKFDNILDECIKLLGFTKKTVSIPVKNLIEVFNLPFWKKRHELYSAWVFTRIVNSLDEFDIKFNVIDNALSFSFGGSHLATCIKLNPPLQIWAELRTEHKSPISSKRKSHIQPDYTLAIKNVNEPENSIAIVECKQYKKYNTKNFTEAVVDYANGRPNSKVFLVNYTSIPKAILNRLSTDIAERTMFLGPFYPKSASVTEFEKSIYNTIVNYYKNFYEKENLFLKNIFSFKLPFEITLKWGDCPRDLDLHLQITELSGEQHHISYMNSGSNADIPFAYLNKDCINGHGNETITINQWLDGSYDICVHNFSGEQSISQPIELKIRNDDFTISLTCSKSIEKNSVWNAFKFDKNDIEKTDIILPQK